MADREAPELVIIIGFPVGAANHIDQMASLFLIAIKLRRGVPQRDGVIARRLTIHCTVNRDRAYPACIALLAW